MSSALNNVFIFVSLLQHSHTLSAAPHSRLNYHSIILIILGANDLSGLILVALHGGYMEFSAGVQPVLQDIWKVSAIAEIALVISDALMCWIHVCTHS